MLHLSHLTASSPLPQRQRDRLRIQQGECSERGGEHADWSLTRVHTRPPVTPLDPKCFQCAHCLESLLSKTINVTADFSALSHLELSHAAASALGPPLPQLVPRPHRCCLPLQDDVWGCRWSVPCLALPLVPFDAGHEKDVGKGQAGHGGSYPEGNGTGGFVDVDPAPALSDLQGSPADTAEHLKQQNVSAESFPTSAIFTLWAG